MAIFYKNNKLRVTVSKKRKTKTKKAKKQGMCAPGLTREQCDAKKDMCSMAMGNKRSYCRTLKNKKVHRL